MYRCCLCGTCVPPRTPAVRVPLETRVRHYPFRAKVHPVKGKAKADYKDDPGGVGVEVVREGLACPSCAERRAG